MKPDDLFLRNLRGLLTLGLAAGLVFAFPEVRDVFSSEQNWARLLGGLGALKFGAKGLFRSAGQGSAWADHSSTTNAVPRVSDAAIEATAAYCEYMWSRYGRFPVYMPPYKTVLGFQACHLDLEFYEKFYRPEALAESQRQDWTRNQGNPR